MLNIKILLICIIFALCFGGCTGSGINFAPESVKKLTVKKTTKEQVIQMFGKPESSKKTLDGNTNSTIEVYSYSKANGFADTWKYKELVLEYIGDTLNGFLYSNSFDKYSTDINAGGIDKLKLNQSTREEIIAEFGNNYGEVVFPTNLIEQNKSSVKSNDSTKSAATAMLYRYVYFERDRNNRASSHYRTLLLYLNADGILIDRFYTDNITK
jgi:hypothetical protein